MAVIAIGALNVLMIGEAVWIGVLAPPAVMVFRPA